MNSKKIVQRFGACMLTLQLVILLTGMIMSFVPKLDHPDTTRLERTNIWMLFAAGFFAIAGIFILLEGYIDQPHKVTEVWRNRYQWMIGVAYGAIVLYGGIFIAILIHEGKVIHAPTLTNATPIMDVIFYMTSALWQGIAVYALYLSIVVGIPALFTVKKEVVVSNEMTSQKGFFRNGHYISLDELAMAGYCRVPRYSRGYPIPIPQKEDNEMYKEMT